MNLSPQEQGSSVIHPGTEFVLYSISAGLLSVQHHYIILLPIKCCGYNGRLVTWPVVCLTSAKFKPHILSMLGFALSIILNKQIFVILCDSCFVVI
jgi:hypothetical protein